MDKYIGQSESFGYWINEVFGGGWQVRGESRTGEGSKTLATTYKTAKTATAAAKREIEKDNA